MRSETLPGATDADANVAGVGACVAGLPPKWAAKPPFPWFGGKSKAAPLVWSLLGDPAHYVEPFAGGLAALLGRPHPCNRPYFSETVNDCDGFIVNAWRAIQWHPDAVAEAASWPVSEADKIARQIACLKWRENADLEHLMGDARWCDPLIAGWWLYGVACQIGAFAGDGAWRADPATGRIYKQARGPKREPGVIRSRPGIISGGRAVAAPQLREPGVSRDRPHISDNGRAVAAPQLRAPGVRRNLPHISDGGQAVAHASLRAPGVSWQDEPVCYHPHTMPRLREWMHLLSARLRHVRIVNGDWRRVCTTGAMFTLPVRQAKGVCGVFLDPPYSNAVRSGGLYAGDADDGDVAADARAWCIERGDDTKLRIVLAGFAGEGHEALLDHGWREYEWFTQGFLSGGMGNTGKNGKTHQQHRERLYASPHCLVPDAGGKRKEGVLF